LLTGDTLAKTIGAFKRQITNLANMVKMEAPFEDILTNLGKLSVLMHLTVVEPLQDLDFVGIQTPGGFNTKEDVVTMFAGLAESFDSIGNMIKAGIANGVPESKIYSIFLNLKRSCGWWKRNSQLLNLKLIGMPSSRPTWIAPPRSPSVERDVRVSSPTPLPSCRNIRRSRSTNCSRGLGTTLVSSCLPPNGSWTFSWPDGGAVE
jgi:hypothetical protein